MIAIPQEGLCRRSYWPPRVACLRLRGERAAVGRVASLDFEFFRVRVQQVFTTKRPGNARCVTCHTVGTPMRLQPLSPGSATWNEEQSRKNFEIVRLRVVPGNPAASRLLQHPLAESAGGDPHHDGGTHWTSKDDREYQMLAAWVPGDTMRSVAAVHGNLRIIQTNSAGYTVHVIDPLTNTVVGQINGIEVGHGAAAAPDGSRLYFSNEADATLDVVDGRTLRVTNTIALSGHPNNIAASRDGKRVYVAILGAPGAVDVIDTVAPQRVKSISVKGAVHNTKDATIIDAQTEQPLWVLDFELGVRPMAFETNPDGSTKRMCVQLTEFNGFAVVDFATHKEVTRIELPKLGPGKKPIVEGGNASHGMAVSADGQRLVVDSRLNSAVYVYSLPGLTLLGSVDVGRAPDWVTLTPDGKTAYVANAGSNSVSVVDVVALKEVTRIPVGQVPKRNITVILP
jgi:YVTN family beta-propeller protein